MPDLMYPKPGGNFSASVNAQQQREYSVTYQVELAELKGPGYARNLVLAQLSGIGHYYFFLSEFDIYAYLQDVEVSVASEDGLTYEATCNYGPAAPLPENPFAEPIELSVDWAPYQKYTDVNASGGLITNSANDPISPGVEVTTSNPILKISRNEPDYPIFDVFTYKDSTNNATWNGFPANTVLATAPRATLQYSSTSGAYYKIDYEFLIAPSGWNAKLLDIGYRENISGVTKNIYVDGQPVSTPKLLNGSGKVLPTSGNPVFFEHQVYPMKDFAFWNLSF